MDSMVKLTYPGQVDFEYLKLISSKGIVVDLNDYLIELNLYEDIFSNFLHGQVMISDSNNLLSRLPIIGEEFLVVSFGTPQLNSHFKKYFKVYSVTDQKTVTDNSTQTYIIHFMSVEGIYDSNLSIFEPYSGLVSDIAQKIYTSYLATSSYVKFIEDDIIPDEETQTPFLYTETQNKIKFISPGWSPSKCLNWLCSKAIPQEGNACDFLFWESTKGFFFGSIEDIFRDSENSNKIAGSYFYVPTGTVDSNDLFEKLFLAESFEVVSVVDNLKNSTNGFYANKIITYDPLTKAYESKDFDYPSTYDAFKHTEGNLSVPNFSLNAYRNPAAYTKIYPANSKLFSGVQDNYPTRMKDIFGNRTTKLNELDNFKINLTVHGRSDMFAGCLVEFVYPETSPKGTVSDKGQDQLYSGIYLVSAIRHKINYRTHVMVMELIKDSLAARQ
jgi:hypothetical protein